MSEAFKCDKCGEKHEGRPANQGRPVCLPADNPDGSQHRIYIHATVDLHDKRNADVCYGCFRKMLTEAVYSGVWE